MINNNSNNLKRFGAFTLIEMLIVLIIVGIMTMLTMGLSGDQISKIQNKAVKENLLSERQSNYSKVIGSSSYNGKMYNNMIITISSGDNKISFDYTGNNNGKDEDSDINNGISIFSDSFIISSITGFAASNTTVLNKVSLTYTPYHIKCKISDNDSSSDNSFEKIIMGIKVRESADYCFEINSNNCRLIQVNCDSPNTES